MDRQINLHNLSECVACERDVALCVCDQIAPFTPRTKILILQHPQEPDKVLGTARIAHRMLNGSVLRIGLSWRNLEHALAESAERADWGVLYLGSFKPPSGETSPFLEIDRKGDIMPGEKQLRGIVVLDGTWSQAKALWWRNAWLLKLRRVVLVPQHPSLYGRLRREPRVESVSTIEAIGASLAWNEKRPQLYDELVSPFRTLLERYRTAYNDRSKPQHRKKAFHRS